MKILLVQDLERPHHGFRPEHLKKIQAVDPSLELVLLNSTQLDEIHRELENADILAGTLWSIPEIHEVKNLKWIHSFSAGVEHVLTPEVKNSDVIVGNCSGIHAVPIAEHILGFLLIFTRRFYETFRNQQQKIWQKSDKVTELKGKIVLVVGLGNIGMEAARLASCVGARVLAADRALRQTQGKPDFVEELYTTEQLGEALPRADFVVLCLPLTKATHHLFDSSKFRIMKSSAAIINIGRGAVIHEQNLIAALQQKVIAGAALDVTEQEPLAPENPLWGMENVVITPHHSGISEKYMDRAVDVFCENLKAYLQGERLPNLVDKEKGY
ncbi:MAG: D-2-hydroxyacid dehydrogenase [Candidatus Wildermuthbacteria bacterium]|nr:D-2-hydroxyacid dehydrogenase [Candidatus Wildermuthbacteria bacterium]